jgi:integrase
VLGVSKGGNYIGWVRRFIAYNHRRHPADLGPADIRRFVSALATKAHVSASTQNQAMAAIAFHYHAVLHVPMESVDDIVHAKRPVKLPVVLSRDEVDAALAKMRGTARLAASLLYGGGLRLLEALTLRVKDVDLESRQLTIRGGKGGKDRMTVLPRLLLPPLTTYLSRMQHRHKTESAWKKIPVTMPASIARKYPSAPYE